MVSTDKLAKTSFSGIDFTNIVDDIVGMIKDNPNYSIYWEDFTSNDYTKLLIELFAWIADQLATRVDFAVNENFLSTAQQKQSIINLLKLIGYDLAKPYAARVDVDFTKRTTFPLGVTVIDFTKEFIQNNVHASTDIYQKPFSITTAGNTGLQKTFELIPYRYDTENERYRYYYGEKVFFESTDIVKTLSLYEGTTIKEYHTIDTDNGAKFSLTSTGIIENSIEVYLEERTSTEDDYTYTEVELYQTKAFTTPQAQSLSNPIPYSLNTLADNGVEIEFASSFIIPNSAKRPVANSTVVVYYRIGGGVGGNVVQGSFNQQLSFENVIFSLYNNLAGSGGVDEESTENAIKYAPKTLKTVDKTVTEEDYDTVIQSNVNTLISKSYGSNSGVDEDTLLDKYETLIKPFEVWNYIIPNKVETTELKTYDYSGYEFFTKNKSAKLNNVTAFRNGFLNEAATLYTPTLLMEDLKYFEQDPEVNNTTDVYNYTIIQTSDDFKNALLSGDNVNGAFKLKIRENPTVQTRISDITDHIHSGETDYALDFDFDFDFAGNGNPITSFANGNEFRVTNNVKAFFKSRFGSSSFYLLDDHVLKMSVDNRGFVEVILPTSASVTPATIISTINTTLGTTLGTLGTTTNGLSAAGYLVDYGYYNYPVSYTGLETAPVKFSEVVYSDDITGASATILEGSSNGSGVLNGVTYQFLYDKNGTEYKIDVQFASNDEVTGAVLISKILDLINNENRLVDAVLTVSPFKDKNFRAHLVDNNRLRIFSTDGQTIEILETATFDLVEYNNFLFTMIDGADVTVSTSNVTVAGGYATVAADSGGFIKITSPTNGVTSSVEFMEASGSVDAFPIVFGYSFTPTILSYKSYGIIGATLNVNPDSLTFGNIVLELGTSYRPFTNIYLNYSLANTWTVSFPDLYMLEGSVFNTLGYFDHENSLINVKITTTETDERLFENIVSEPLIYAQKGNILGKTISSTIDTTGKHLSIYISLPDFNISDGGNPLVINFTAGSKTTAEIVAELNAAVKTIIDLESAEEYYGLYENFQPFYVSTINVTDTKIAIRNYDCTDMSFTYFYEFTNTLGVITADTNNIFESFFTIADFIDIATVEDETTLAVFNTGDYYIENGILSNNTRTISIVKNHSGNLDISAVPDGEIYIHFVNDKTPLQLDTDESYYSDYLDRYKILGIENLFMDPEITPIDIAGKIYYDPKYLASTIKQNIDTILIDNLKLGNLEFGEPMTLSYVSSLIHQVAGVRYANVSYMGTDYLVTSTNQINKVGSTGKVEADFDEILVAADNEFTGVTQIHGIIFEYESV